ncbi:MAG: hypothetical protein IPK58_24155 [Acidobacteria bacterium]|nr:hypothetical protein [Acidobacteriota bacterium]
MISVSASIARAERTAPSAEAVAPQGRTHPRPRDSGQCRDGFVLGRNTTDIAAVARTAASGSLSATVTIREASAVRRLRRSNSAVRFSSDCRRGSHPVKPRKVLARTANADEAMTRNRNNAEGSSGHCSEIH